MREKFTEPDVSAACHSEKPYNPAKTFADIAQMKDLSQINARSMQIFLAVIGEGSFSEVARQENIAPSSVSRTVFQLEQSLETQLLYRNTRAVVATDAGNIYAEAFRGMLNQLDNALNLISERRQEPGGLLRFNAPVSFGLRHIAPWVAELSERYPALKLELNLTDNYIEPLADGTDLLLRISPMQDSSLHGRFITRQSSYLVASPAYIERHGYPQTPDDLHNHRLLAYRGLMGLQRWYFTKGEEKLQLMPEPRIVSDNAEMLVKAAQDGAGIVLFPDWQISDSLKAKRLIPLMTDYTASYSVTAHSIYMLYPGGHFPSLNTRSVIDFFMEKFGTPPYWQDI
ncbi:LysR substrate binding domain protein [Cedecea davisae DSM 4568]|uniref:LysR substrate binding domain protein n=2 Tax=Cedecea davisae TaxID=158484 RepID=S3IR16_9ENTR|nr:LysR substrate binding domain protein [Cedecea davisae DSM 4568]